MHQTDNDINVRRRGIPAPRILHTHLTEVDVDSCDNNRVRIVGVPIHVETTGSGKGEVGHVEEHDEWAMPSQSVLDK